MINLGLERISRLLASTPLRWRAIHVAGTNGKGSVCAYISRMLDVYNDSDWRKEVQWISKATGESHIYKKLIHGRFTSPHLIDRWDCITINSESVSFKKFQAVENRVTQRNQQQSIGASNFELLTATAFELFNDEKVDVAVVEVGMGGRQDATNVIGQAAGLDRSLDPSEARPPPLITALTPVALDHQEFLGDTLADIAREKVGIIKPGVPVIPHDEWYDWTETAGTLNEVAMAQGSPVITWHGDSKTAFAMHCMDIINLKLNFNCRDHMKGNAAVAFVATWTALMRLGRIPTYAGLSHEPNEAAQESSPQLDAPVAMEALPRMAESMIDSVRNVTFPGRQEMLSIASLTGRKEQVLLDGAHNEHSAKALGWRVSLLRTVPRPEYEDESYPVTWVLAASSSKDAEALLSPLLRGGDSVFAVEFGPVDGMPWVKPMPASQLVEAAKAVVDDPATLQAQDYGRDILGALKAASEGSEAKPMVIAGSLYLVGDVLRLLRDAEKTSGDSTGRS